MLARIAKLLLILGIGIAPSFAEAQSYPSRPLRIIVGFPAGGSVDKVARLISQHLTASLGQQIIVDNRPGAHGIIGTELAANAAPDGYTLLMASGGHSINPTIFKKLPYDPIKDFTTISRIASYPMLLLAHPSLPVHSVKDLVALAKAKPKALNYASTGPGSTAHLTMEMFGDAAKVSLTHIPYKGGAPALTDLIAGQTQVMFNVILVGLPHVTSGKLRGIAVTSAKRSTAAPKIPTIAESGYPGFETGSWTGVLGPAGIPQEIVGKLHKEIVRVAKTDGLLSRLNVEGAEIIANSPAAFAAQIKAEIEKWRQIVKIAGVSLDH